MKRPLFFGEVALPRWRASRDTQTIFYISASQVVADKKSWAGSLANAGTITGDDFREAMDAVGVNAGMGEILSSAKVSEKVKKLITSLIVCMGEVVGSNAHRTLLRHELVSYMHFFGAPLAFLTPNLVDGSSLVMRLL